MVTEAQKMQRQMRKVDNHLAITALDQDRGAYLNDEGM
jgi:hypothetical protein